MQPTVRMLLPIVLPTDKANSRPNKNMMWMLTCRSTAVRLIGAALVRMSDGGKTPEYNLTWHFALASFRAQ